MTDQPPTMLKDVLQLLVEINRIRRKIEAGTASQIEQHFYDLNNEAAWKSAEAVLGATVTPRTCLAGGRD